MSRLQMPTCPYCGSFVTRYSHRRFSGADKRSATLYRKLLAVHSELPIPSLRYHRMCKTVAQGGAKEFPVNLDPNPQPGRNRCRGGWR